MGLIKLLRIYPKHLLPFFSIIFVTCINTHIFFLAKTSFQGQYSRQCIALYIGINIASQTDVRTYVRTYVRTHTSHVNVRSTAAAAADHCAIISIGND